MANSQVSITSSTLMFRTEIWIYSRIRFRNKCQDTLSAVFVKNGYHFKARIRPGTNEVMPFNF
jgi:hypothetical protein